MYMKDYMNDHATAVARAVLAYMQDNPEFDVSWSDQRQECDAKIRISPFLNYREAGYIFSVAIPSVAVPEADPDELRQVNVAVFEHKNIDEICVVAVIICMGFAVPDDLAAKELKVEVLVNARRATDGGDERVTLLTLVTYKGKGVENLTEDDIFVIARIGQPGIRIDALENFAGTGTYLVKVVPIEPYTWTEESCFGEITVEKGKWEGHALFKIEIPQ